MTYRPSSSNRSFLAKAKLDVTVEPTIAFKNLLIMRSTIDIKGAAWHFLSAVIVKAGVDYCATDLEAAQSASRYLESDLFADHCGSLGLDDVMVGSAVHDLERYCLKNRLIPDTDQAKVVLDADQDRG